MERTEQHEVDTQAGRLFVNKLPPWIIFRPQPQDDYGVDGELEIIQDEQKTGIIIKIQLKGSKEPNHLASCDEISFVLDTKHVEYYLDELDIPLALILCDVTKNIVYWSALQNNTQLIQYLKSAKQSGQQTITVRINTKNTLPETLGSFLDEMIESQNRIALKIASKVNRTSYASFVQSLEKQDIHSALEQSKQNTEVIFIEIIDRTIKSNQYEEADRLIKEVLTTDSYSPLAKLSVLIITEKLAFKIDKNQIFSFYLWQAAKMTELKDKLDFNQQKLIEGYVLSAEVAALSKRWFDLHTNWKIHGETDQERQRSAGPFWLPILMLEKNKTSQELLSSLSKLDTLIKELLEQKLVYLIPPTIIRFMTQFHHFPMILRREANLELSKAADDLENWMETNINFAISILERFTDKIDAGNKLGRCAVVFAMYAMNATNKKDHWKTMANETLNKISNQITKKFYQDITFDLYKDIDVDYDPEKPDWDMVKQFYTDQARSVLGVRFELLLKPKETKSEDDLNFDLDYGIAQIISVGITDLDAKPFFQLCKHYVYELTGGIGEPARMLKLPTARMKTVACVKHPEHRGITGLALGPTTSFFASKHCGNCPDKQPHDSAWIFSEPWLERQQDLWDLARNFDPKDRTRVE